MAISYIGGASDTSTTVALPGTAQAGDLAIVVAGRANTGGPSIPLGWNDLGVIAGGSGGSAHGQRVGWKILESADITAGNVGTWTNANKIQVLIYRGASGVSANHSGTGANSSTITFPARSSLASGSWVCAVATHRTATSTRSVAATSYTNRSSAFTAVEAGGMDTNGAVSSIVQRTFVANASSGNVGRTMEITESSAPPPITGTGGITAPVGEVLGVGGQEFISSGALSAPVGALSGDGGSSFNVIGGVTAPITTLNGTGAIAFFAAGNVEAPAATLSIQSKQKLSLTGGIVSPVTTINAEGKQTHLSSGGITSGITLVNGSSEQSFVSSSSISSPIGQIAANGKVTFKASGGVEANVTSVNGTINVFNENLITLSGSLTAPVGQSIGEGKVKFVATGGVSSTSYCSALAKQKFNCEGSVSQPLGTISGTAIEGDGSPTITVVLPDCPRPDFLDNEHLNYLDRLCFSGRYRRSRLSGKLQKEYPTLTKAESKIILDYWISIIPWRTSTP